LAVSPPNSAPSVPPTRVRWMIFALACAASWLLYLHRYAWGIVKPAFKRENPGFTDVELGWLDSAFLATYSLGQVPCGLAGDRFGPRATLSLFTLIWSLAVGSVGWTTGFWRIFAARATFGLAQAGAYPVISKMTQTWFPLTIRTSVQGVVTAMGRVGGACAPVIVATFLMGLLGLSWHTALLALTVPGVILAIAFWLAIRNRPSEHPWTNAAEQDLLDDGPHSAAHHQTRKERPRLELTGASLFSLGMLCFYIFVSSFQDQFFVYWLPLFLKEGRGFDDTMMGLFAPLPLLGGACGGILGGFLNDFLIRRLGSRRWGRSCVAFTGKLTAGLLVLLSIQYLDGRVTMLILVAARVFSDWSMPTQWGAVTDMGGRAAATVFGVVNSVGAAGGFAAGPVFGYLKQQYGWEGVFYGVAGMCVTAALSWLFIDCTKRLVGD
jgi:MFS transporter, ACS family, glucarate transporter